YQKGMTDEAIAQLEKAITLYGKDPILYDHLGDAYSKKGLKDKAKECWKKSLELKPDQKQVREKLEKSERAQK
ncbi:MAG TPA: tetratricopeptide repeat protein, partial [Candidatus Omnitrophota bacterium]|nr:tetratricopeptide repeat protein [Candidatus Omnitrophota bacterium]